MISLMKKQTKIIVGIIIALLLLWPHVDLMVRKNQYPIPTDLTELTETEARMAISSASLHFDNPLQHIFGYLTLDSEDPVIVTLRTYFGKELQQITLSKEDISSPPYEELEASEDE
jgi:hypothetical protein